MNDQDFNRRLYDQLRFRRKQPDPLHHRLLEETKRIRKKDIFWSGTVITLFFTGVAALGIIYLAALNAGLLKTPPVLPIHDARWGTQYNIPEAPLTSMISNDQQVFVGTAGNGLHIYDKASRLWKVQRRTYGKHELPDDVIRWLKFDDDDPEGIWALTRNGGGAFASKHTVGWRTVFGATPFPGRPEQDLTTVARSGPLIAVGTQDRGLNLYDLRVRDWVAQIREMGAPGLPSDRINTVRTGEDGVFWVGTSGGLALLEGTRLSGVFLADSAYNDISALEISPDGAWYLTKENISIGHVDRSGAINVMLRTTPLPFSPSDMSSAAQHEHTLWVGTRNRGVQRYDLESHAWGPVRIPLNDSSGVTGVTALGYNNRTEELYVGSDEGLFVVPRAGATPSAPADTRRYPEFHRIRNMKFQDEDAYFLTDTGRLGLRRGGKAQDAENPAWWRLLSGKKEGISDVATLVDMSAARIAPEDITAACQSDEYLYFGTVHGDIVWYHKPSHSWHAINIPLPYAIDELIYNPYTGSTVALSGHALYRSPPTLDVFILYLSIPTDDIRVVPTPTGYLIFTDASILTHFDETTNRRDLLLAGVQAPETTFEPVSMDRTGALLNFVTGSGRVLSYDTLRHRWESPAEIPHTDVTDLRGVGFRTVYQTRENHLHVSGSFTLIGGGALGLTDHGIRRAASDPNNVWVAGDNFIGVYDKNTHTWQNRRRLDLPDQGAPSHLIPLAGKIAYRTGLSEETAGALWLEDRQVDRGVGALTGANGTLWYVRGNGLYRLTGKNPTPVRMLDRTGIARDGRERLISAAETGHDLWMATDRRLLTYNKRLRFWRESPLPEGHPVTRLWQVSNMMYAVTPEAVYQRSADEKNWTRISPVGRVVRDAAVSSTGVTLLLDNGHIPHVPIQREPRTGLSLQITPNDLPVPLSLSSTLTAHQDNEYLSLVTPDYFFRYNTRTHLWENPRRVAPTRIRSAVVRDNHLWAATSEGALVTGPLSGTFETFPDPSVVSLPPGVRQLLDSARDEVWVDNPFWRWERKGGKALIAVKPQDGGMVSLTQQAPITRFPFDRVRAVAHDGIDVWLATDMGVIRFGQTSHGDIGAYELYRPGIPEDIDYVRFPNMEYRLISRLRGAPDRYVQYDRNSRSWTPLNRDRADFDPLRDTILIESSLWRWTHRNDGVAAIFTTPGLQGQPVFRPDDTHWRFRFDDVRGTLARGSDLYLASDGIMSRYTLRDSTLALDGMILTPGPPIAASARVRFSADGEEAVYLSVETSRGRRIYRADESNDAFIPYNGPTDPFAVEILIDDGAWRWELEQRTGRVRKYFYGQGAEKREFHMANGRFGFDDFQTFSVAGDQIWLATSAGIARYPLTGTSLPLHTLRLESRIGPHENAAVTQINIKNNTVYCELDRRGGFARPLNRSEWRSVGPEEKPWIRTPVSSPFWTWTHDVKQRTVTGEYRDAQNTVRPVAWTRGMFDFDTVTDIIWHEEKVWMSSPAGLLAYPKHAAYLDIDSLKIYPSLPGIDRLISVPDARPASSGLYTRVGDSIYRFDNDTETWKAIPSPSASDTDDYGERAYLTDLFRYDILVDFDGFWRGRRRAAQENPDRVPQVILETYITGTWQRISMEDGRFDFDIIWDFALDGTYLWLATTAGVCRYDLGRAWLDLRRMTPYWGARFADATDILRPEGGERLFLRRGGNNDAVVEIDPATFRITPVPPGDSPFTNIPLVSTEYWRWERTERYKGSVANGYEVNMAMKTASGAWVPMGMDGSALYFPFDIIEDMVYYQNALWTATPVGVFRYPADQPFSVAHAGFYWEDGQLERARRLMVARTSNQPERLQCETGGGSSRRVYYLNMRDRWQEVIGQASFEDFRFREDVWYWYEVDGRVAIRFQNDPDRIRPIFGRYFADHYVRSIAADVQSFWSLTPAGLFQYAGPPTADSLRLLRWYTEEDLSGTPSGLLKNVEEGERKYSILRSEDGLWLLTAENLMRYRVITPENRLEYVGHIPLPDGGGPWVGGHLYGNGIGRIRVVLQTAIGTASSNQIFLLDPVTGRLVTESGIANYWDADPSVSVVALDEDARYAWVATSRQLFRIDKAAFDR